MSGPSRFCLESDLAICMIGQALYPMMHITWCIYALFMEDEARVQWDCKYEVKPFLDNRAQSLGGYMWAISSIEQEQLQIRCLKETQVIQIRLPLQVVHIGNGCEGYSPSMYILAKSELSGTEEIKSRKEYFLKFNYVYQPDELVGVWWQFRSKLMTIEEAKNFIEKVEPLGTMDYSILNQQLEKVVHIGNGCEGYSPSMYILAKSELSGTEEIKSRKEYFLKFNYVYQPDELVGVWWQFRSKLMTIEEAKNFIEKVEPLGTMDYSILNQQLEKVDSKYPWSLPVPPMGIGGKNRFCAYTAGGSSIRYQTLSSGNNCKRGKGNTQNSNYSAPVMLQVYSKAISPGQDSGDRANQPSRPR